MKHTIPFYPMYPSAFRNDVNVIPLNRAQRGLYRDLLDIMWLSGDCSIPNDLKKLSTLTGWMHEMAYEDSTKDHDVDVVMKLFMPHPSGEKNKLTQKRLYKEWELAIARYNRRAAAGRIGGKKQKRPYPEATTERPAPIGGSAAPPELCPCCGVGMFGSNDSKGEPFSKCQNRKCPAKGMYQYPDGSIFCPKDSQNYVIKGKEVIVERKDGRKYVA